MKIADSNTVRAVRAFLDRLPADIHLERALLYGSRARGDHREGSDADIALILTEGADDWRTLWVLGGIAYNVFVETGILIQPVPVSSQDWTDPDRYPRPSFLRTVTREGIEL